MRSGSFAAPTPIRTPSRAAPMPRRSGVSGSSDIVCRCPSDPGAKRSLSLSADLDRRVHVLVDLAGDPERPLLREPVREGEALLRPELRLEARALHVVRLAVGPDPLDGAALIDVDGLVGADLPGDVGGGEG